MDEEQIQENQRALELEQVRQNDSPPEAEEKSASKEAGKRLSLFKFICFLILFVVLDAVEFFTGGTIGWAIGLVGDGIAWFILHQTKTNREQYRKIAIGMIGDTIPFLDILPLRSIMLVWSYLFP